MTIDLRDFDQREHGAPAKTEAIEYTPDPRLTVRIREAMEQREAEACLERYRRDQCKRGAA